jgi:hypothetical protein
MVPVVMAREASLRKKDLNSALAAAAIPSR